MLSELRAEGDALSSLYGAQSRHWCLNPDAGTIRTRDGTLILYLGKRWLDFEDGQQLNWLIPPPVLRV
jgi:hypothetical protein